MRVHGRLVILEKKNGSIICLIAIHSFSLYKSMTCIDNMHLSRKNHRCLHIFFVNKYIKGTCNNR